MKQDQINFGKSASKPPCSGFSLNRADSGDVQQAECYDLCASAKTRGAAGTACSKHQPWRALKRGFSLLMM
jgi:hypothetical protein